MGLRGFLAVLRQSKRFPNIVELNINAFLKSFDDRGRAGATPRRIRFIAAIRTKSLFERLKVALTRRPLHSRGWRMRCWPP